MTFDEALKAIDEKSDMEPYSGLFLIEIEDAKAIVMKLANTYAPTIEMTKNKYRFITSDYEKVKALYAVVNMKNTDRYGLPTFVTFGYDLDQLLSVYHGKDYRIFELGEL